MRTAFERWLEGLFRHRLYRGQCFGSFHQEWVVKQEDPRKADESLKTMHAFECIECSLWYLVDPPARAIHVTKLGRVCSRCSGFLQ